MIVQIIALLVAVIAIAITVNFYEKKINRERNKISLKESMDLINIPIVTFYVGNNKLNFILDSGADYCHIAKGAVGLLGESEKTPFQDNIVGFGGNASTSYIYHTTLLYKGELFDADLIESEQLDSSFDALGVSHGIKIHGILGTTFLQKYRYVLDFAELVAYQK